MISTIVVDDEELSLKNTLYSLARYSDIRISASFTDSLAALTYIGSNHVDAAFLDIEMPQVDGTLLAAELQKIRPNLLIVFITAHSEYAIRAFEINALDYVLKPVTVEKLQRTILKLRRQHALLTADRQDADLAAVGEAPTADLDRLVAKKDGRIYLLTITDAEYLFSVGRKVFTVIGDNQYELQGSLGEWEHQLAAQGFLRCHKSFIVNVNKIKYIAPMFNNNYMIKISEAKEAIPVSRKYARTLRERLKL